MKIKKNNRLKNSDEIYQPYLNNKITYIEDILWGLLFLSVSLVFTTQTMDQFTLPKLVVLRLCTLCLLLFFCYRLVKGLIKPIPKSVLYSWLALCLLWIASTLFALHKTTALFGAYGRYNGLWNHLLFQLLFFSAATMPMDMKRLERLLKMFTLTLVVVSLYALLQSLKIDPIHWYSFDRPGSTIGQPTILAALVSLALPFALMFFLKNHNVFWLVTALVFLITITVTLGRGVWVAVWICLALFGFLVIKLKKWPLKKIVVLTTALVILASGVTYIFIKNSPAFAKRLKSFTQLKSDVAFQSRLFYYDVAIKGIMDHPLLGVGFENFNTVFPMYRSKKELPDETEAFRNILPTKVHNSYLQIALTNGIPALLVYLAFLTAILVLLGRAYKNTKDHYTMVVSAAFSAAIIGYLIQDISGWNEIVLSAFFWIILGFSVSFCTIQEGKKLRINRHFSVVVSIVLIVFSFLLSVEGVKMLYANSLFQESRYLDIHGDWQRIESNIMNGLNAVGDDFYYQYLAALLYEKRFTTSLSPGHAVQGTDNQAVTNGYEKGCRLLEKAHELNPYALYILIKRVELDIAALKKGVIPSTSDFVRNNIKKLIDTATNNPTVYEVIAKLRLVEKKFDEALHYIRLAIDLRDKNIRYYSIEGDIFRMMNRVEASIDSYRKSIANNGDSKVFREEWIYAKYGIVEGLIQINQFDNALKEMDEVLKYYPEKIDSYLILGDMYGRMNLLEKARGFFEKALKMDPINPAAQRGIQQIESILGSQTVTDRGL